jgi:hypothetical protein
MIMHRLVLTLVIPLPFLLLGSCAGLDPDGTPAAKLAALSPVSLASLKPARVKVVEVRENDLQDFPLGRERALAFKGTEFSRRPFFGGAVDFIEPDLPHAGAELDGSLLPPLAN